MPLEGRGSSTCLICNHAGTFVQNYTLLIKNIKILYEGTDKYYVMLQASRICVSCIGRLFQLFEFNTIKKTLNSQELVDNCCHFCLSSQVMFKDVVHEAVDAVKKTKWAKYYTGGRPMLCCFSCCNYLHLYYNTKKTLDEQNDSFLTRIKRCHVKIGPCPEEVVRSLEDDSDADSVISFDKTTTEPEVVQVELRISALEQQLISHMPESNLIIAKLTINEPGAHPAREISQSNEITEEYAISNTSKRDGTTQAHAEEKISRRHHVLLKRLGDHDINGNQHENIDKFSAIKNRRGQGRSNDLKELPTRKRKTPDNPKSRSEIDELPTKRRNTESWTSKSSNGNLMICRVNSDPPAQVTQDKPPIAQAVVVVKKEIIEVLDEDQPENHDAVHDRSKIPVLTVALENKSDVAEPIYEPRRSKVPLEYVSLHNSLRKAKLQRESMDPFQAVLQKEKEKVKKSFCNSKAVIIKSGPKSRTNLNKFAKSNTRLAAHLAQEEFPQVKELSFHNAIEIDIAKEHSKRFAFDSKVEIISDNELFETERSLFDTENSIELALFPQLQDLNTSAEEAVTEYSIPFAAEVIISEEISGEQEIPLNTRAERTENRHTSQVRPTAEDCSRFQLKKCTVDVALLSQEELKTAVGDRMSDLGRFTKSGRKCLKPRKLLEFSEDEFALEPKPKKPKKPFELKLFPGPKSSKKKRADKQNKEKKKSTELKHGKEPKEPKLKDKKMKKEKKVKIKENPKEWSNHFGGEEPEFIEDFVDFTKEYHPMQMPEDVLQPQIQFFKQPDITPKLKKRRAESCQPASMETEVEFLAADQKHKGKFIISRPFLLSPTVQCFEASFRQSPTFLS